LLLDSRVTGARYVFTAAMTAVVAGVLIILTVRVGGRHDVDPRTPPGLDDELVQSGKALRVSDVRARIGPLGQHWFIEGTIHNDSGHDLDQLEAVAKWTDDGGKTVAVDSAPIEQVLLQSGGTSRFKILTRIGNQLHAFTIEIHDGRGKPIPVSDFGPFVLPDVGETRGPA
jgi:hypothetical protein